MATDIAITGAWNGNGRDEFGVWRPSTWRFYLDTDLSFTPTVGDETSRVFGVATDKPLSGRW